MERNRLKRQEAAGGPWRGLRQAATATLVAACLGLAGVAMAKDAEPERMRTDTAPPLTKPPSIVWDRHASEFENPLGGGFCGDTAESCGTCPEGMSRATYIRPTSIRPNRHAYICCRGEDFPVIRSATGVGRYGVCEICAPDTIRALSQPQHRDRGRHSCYACRRAGYEWRTHRGETVCLSCGSSYDYDARSGLCRLKGPPRPRRPERQTRPRP